MGYVKSEGDHDDLHQRAACMASKELPHLERVMYSQLDHFFLSSHMRERKESTASCKRWYCDGGIGRQVWKSCFHCASALSIVPLATQKTRPLLLRRRFKLSSVSSCFAIIKKKTYLLLKGDVFVRFVTNFENIR